jgi:uncharacterized protein YggE
MRNRFIFPIILVALASLISGCAGAAFAQTTTPVAEEGKPATRTLNVTGSGKAFLTPDIAYVNVGVHTEDKSASQAVAKNSQDSQAVADALKEFGIDPKDIQTTNFSIYPQQQYDSNGKPTGEITYTVDNTVYVTVRDLDKVGELLDAVVKAGANSINSIQFDVADKTTALSAARKAAVEDAQAVAEELAAASGVTLGDVQTISIYSNETPQPVSSGGVVKLEAPSVPISPGQMILTVQVNIIYEIH